MRLALVLLTACALTAGCTSKKDSQIPSGRPPTETHDNAVDNTLPAGPANPELIDKIRQEISAAGVSRKGQEINIVAEGDGVILSGNVPSVDEKNKLLAAAKKHAKLVRDNLSVTAATDAPVRAK